MSLSLKHPDETETYQLLRQDKGACAVEDNNQVLLTDLVLLKKSNPSLDEYDMQIFRARMSGQDVIVKYTDEEQIAIPRLEYESRIYVDRLKPLWGVHVPRFYGFYLYDPKERCELSRACVILQYCGEPAVSDLLLLKDYRRDDLGVKRFRNDTMDIYFRLHSPEIELAHNALKASHILDFDGKPFLIDFADSGYHDCFAWEEGKQLTRDVLPAKEGEILRKMGSQSVKCYELWNFLRSVDYGLPTQIKLYGENVPCESITSAAYLYKLGIRRRWPRFRSKEELWDTCVKYWRLVHSNWKKYHPDAAVEPPLGIVDLQEYLDSETDC